MELFYFVLCLISIVLAKISFDQGDGLRFSFNSIYAVIMGFLFCVVTFV